MTNSTGKWTELSRVPAVSHVKVNPNKQNINTTFITAVIRDPSEQQGPFPNVVRPPGCQCPIPRQLPPHVPQKPMRSHFVQQKTVMEGVKASREIRLDDRRENSDFIVLDVHMKCSSLLRIALCLFRMFLETCYSY